MLQRQGPRQATHDNMHFGMEALRPALLQCGHKVWPRRSTGTAPAGLVP